jgi:aubergine-like protein
LRFRCRHVFSLDVMSDAQRHYMPQMLHFLNILAKKALQASDYKQIGRLPKFFTASDKRVIPEYQLEMWPGYLATTRLVRDGIFLNIDTVSKFIQQTTILDLISELTQKGMNKTEIAALFDSSNEDTPRKTVMTKYNTRTYQVDGLDW